MALRQLASRAARAVTTGVPSLAIKDQLAPACLRAGAARFYSSEVPSGFMYADSHEYAKIEGDIATLGITDFAQACGSELGDVVYVEVPEVGTKLEKGSAFGVLESVKASGAASDVYAPLSGEVIEANSALVDDPSLVNTDPYAGGWMAKIKISNPSEAEALMDDAAYTKHVEASAH